MRPELLVTIVVIEGDGPVVSWDAPLCAVLDNGLVEIYRGRSAGGDVDGSSIWTNLLSCLPRPLTPRSLTVGAPGKDRGRVGSDALDVLVLNGHGMGIRSSLGAIDTLLGENRRYDLIIADACSMMTMEAVVALAHRGDYYLAVTGDMPILGLPYAEVVELLRGCRRSDLVDTIARLRALICEEQSHLQGRFKHPIRWELCDLSAVRESYRTFRALVSSRAARACSLS